MDKRKLLGALRPGWKGGRAKTPICIDCGKISKPQHIENQALRCLSCNNRFRWNQPGYRDRVSKKMSETLLREGTFKGEKNPRWMGDKVSYGAIHSWVRTHFGKPRTCESCGIKELNSYKMHWANLSKEYKRERKDWVRLCAKCHKNFDKGFKQTKYVR